jgi:hypothetical protein
MGLAVDAFARSTCAASWSVMVRPVVAMVISSPLLRCFRAC